MTALDKEPERAKPKPIFWVGSSRRDVRAFPKGVRRTFGQALYDAQTGGRHPEAKPLRGFGGAGVQEVIESDRGGAYRAVYTVKFVGAVYVLHVFQKKSKAGIKTPPREIETVRARFQEAARHHAEWIKTQGQASDKGSGERHPG